MSDVRARLERVVGADAVSTWTEPGGRELPLAAPADEAGCVELVRLAAADGLALVPLGLGTKAGWCAPAERADLALTTRRLAGVTAYEPGDGTVSALAGTRMADLAAAVRDGGHRLVPDVPRPDEATLGGVVAAGQSGVRRLRLGPARNHALGARALLADGTVAKSGGRLVKNVTGYDLHRLYAGSYGTLAVLLEVSLRLFALPEREAAFTATAETLGAALDACRRALALPPVFDVAAVHGSDADGWRVTLAFSGRAAAVEAHAGSVREALLGQGVSDATTLAGEEARAAVDAVRDAERADGDGRDRWPTLRLAARPSRLAPAAEAVRDVARELGDPPPRLLLHPGVATLDAWLASDDAAGELAPLLERAGTVRWPAVAPALRKELRAAPPAGHALMARLRDALDPAGVFARGRFPEVPA